MMYNFNGNVEIEGRAEHWVRKSREIKVKIGLLTNLYHISEYL